MSGSTIKLTHFFCNGLLLLAVNWRMVIFEWRRLVVGYISILTYINIPLSQYDDMAFYHFKFVQ